MKHLHSTSFKYFHLQALEDSWQQIVDLTESRHRKLQESEQFQNFISRLEEEEAWMNEKQQLLSSPQLGENMAAVQGLLKKHDTFQVDLQVHEQRIAELQKQGEEVGDFLIKLKFCYLISFNSGFSLLKNELNLILWKENNIYEFYFLIYIEI